MTPANERTTKQAWKGQNKERDVMKDDAFRDLNPIIFEYSRWLKKSSTVPSIGYESYGYTDVPSQLLLRACHDTDANRKRVAGLSKEVSPCT